MKKTRIVSVPVLSLVASLALAGGGDSQDENAQGHNNHEHARGHDQRTISAPELDPGQALTALVLLGGAVRVIREFRRKK